MVIFQPDRVLLTAFVRKHAHLLTGHLLDIGGADGKRYRGFLGHVQKYTVLDPDEKNHPDILSSVEHIPLANASIDSILCIEVLMYVSDVKKAVQEIARVLKPGGTLLLTTAFMGPEIPGTHDCWRFSGQGLRELLDPYFENITVEQRGTYYSERAQHWIRHKIWKHNLYKRPLVGRFYSLISMIRGRIALWQDKQDTSEATRNYKLGFNVLAKRKP